MEKAAVLHWLQGVHAASSFDATGVEEPNEWYFNPDSDTIVCNTSTLNSSHHTNPPNKQQPENLCTQLPYRGSAKQVPLSSLVPSSTFQVPQDPSELEPTATVRKLMCSSTLSGGLTERKQSLTINKTQLDRETCHPPHLLATEQDSIFPKVFHRNSNSPLPAANPEMVLPTINLTREISSRKPLSKNVASAVFTSSSLKPTVLSDASKSAPVSPAVKHASELTVTSPSGTISLSQYDLSKLGNILTSSNSDSTTSNDDTDNGSHIAEKGGLSDPASSDDSKLLSDFGSSSSVPKLSVLEVINTQQLDSAVIPEASDVVVDTRCECLLEATSVGVIELSELSGRTFVGSGTSNSEKAVASLKSLVDESANNELVDLEEVVEEKELAEGKEKRQEEGDTTVSHEEELLEILRKWYVLGYGEKQDLVRALRLTGHGSCADKLLIEEDTKRHLKLDTECQETRMHDEPEGNSGLDGIQHSLLPSKEVMCTISASLSSSLPADESVLCQPPSHQALQTDSAPLCLTSHHPPLLPQSQGHSLPLQPHSPPHHLPFSPWSHCPQPPHISHHPLQSPVFPATISRKKLAEMDKASAFSFDDSSDDFQCTKPSKFSPRRNTVFTRTHNRSLSDYSGSLTSSSSQGSHMISPRLPCRKASLHVKGKGVPRFMASRCSSNAEHSGSIKHFNVSPSYQQVAQHGFTDLERKGTTLPEMEIYKDVGTARPNNKLYCSSDMKQLNAVTTSPNAHQQSATPEKASHLNSQAWIMRKRSGELSLPRRK